MAITSTGYVGTIMENGPWAAAQGPLGGEYFAESFAAGRVTAQGSTARTVRVGNGVIGAHGITDTLSGTNDITLTNPASGTVWYPIYARRTWQTTQATTLVAGAPVTAVTTLPARSTTKGTIDEQPLALVQIQKDNPSILNIVDLRAVGWGKGHFISFDTRVLQYMTKAGYTIRIGDDTYERVLSTSGAESWRKTVSLPSWSATGITWSPTFMPYTGAGWSGIAYSVVDNVGYVNGALKKGTNADGSWAELTHVLTIPEPCRPARRVSGLNAQITATGQVILAQAGKGAVDISLVFPIA